MPIKINLSPKKISSVKNKFACDLITCKHSLIIHLNTVLLSPRVIEEELKDASSEDVPPLTPLAGEVKTEQEQKIVTQLGIMIRIIGDRVRDDKEFQE